MVHPAAASDPATQFIPATGRTTADDAQRHQAGDDAGHRGAGYPTDDDAHHRATVGDNDAATTTAHHGDTAPAAATGRDVARAAIMAIVGVLLMLPAIAVMPQFGQWMADHGPFAVMLPFMLWMMLAGGLLSSGVMTIIAAARS